MRHFSRGCWGPNLCHRVTSRCNKVIWGNSVKTYFIAVYFRQLVSDKGSNSVTGYWPLCGGCCIWARVVVVGAGGCNEHVGRFYV